MTDTPHRRLAGKVALVTGAARGIGLAIVQRFAEEGAEVVGTDIRDAVGEHAVRNVHGAAYRHLDVRVESDWERCVDALLATQGRLDILVNNAGITGFEDGPRAHDPEHTSLADWRAVHATNLDGVFLGCKFGIRAMRSTGAGSIINMSSRSGQVGIAGAAAYASSKAAVRNHSKTVALYCAQQGLQVRCNSVHPAAILTPMWDAVLGDGPDRDARMAPFIADVPLHRFGTPREVADLVVYLASDESAYTTGAEFVLDGGILAGAAASPR